MSKKKSLPYIFLAFLVAVLLFILGVRYGAQVEKVNKTISYLVSLPPSPTIAPTLPPLGFSSYIHEGCGISFVVPNLIEKINESTTSAYFLSHEKKYAMELYCGKIPFIQAPGEKITTINSLRTFETTTQKATSYRLFNPKNGFVVIVSASKEYLPLLQSSVSLIK